MKKILLTSSGFQGEIEVLYNSQGLIWYIDFRNASLEPVQVEYLKQHIPIQYHNDDVFREALRTNKIRVLTEAFEIIFEMFFDKYNKRINRLRCLRYWERMAKAKKIMAYTGITSYNRHLDQNKWKTKADPETYLKNEYWNNDWNTS
jgi:hypothetical protein